MSASAHKSHLRLVPASPSCANLRRKSNIAKLMKLLEPTPVWPSKPPQYGNLKCGICSEKHAKKEGEVCMFCFYSRKTENEEKEQPKLNKNQEKNKKTDEITDGHIWGIGRIPKSCSIVPNSIGRTSLFCEKEGDAPSFKAQSSQKNTSVYYAGKQLGHEHFMVWLALIKRAHDMQSFGFSISRAKLKKAARITINSKRLGELLCDLNKAEIEVRTKIKTEHKTFAGKLIKTLGEAPNGNLSIYLDYGLTSIMNGDCSIINLDLNKALKSRLARALHPYFASHAAMKKNVWITFANLKMLCGSKAGDQYDQFPKSMAKALNQLKVNKVIEGFEVFKSDNGSADRHLEFWKNMGGKSEKKRRKNQHAKPRKKENGERNENNKT